MVRNQHIIEERIKNDEFVLIAEIGVNYYDIAKKEGVTPMEAAKKMVKEAALSGAHAVKFQSYKANTLASKDSPYYWDIKEESTRSQYELFQKFDSFGKGEYKELCEYCSGLEVEFLSTPFDLDSADYLESFMNVYKISSSDLNNLPFIEYLAKKNKPIILSVGASNEDEIARSVELIRRYNDRPLTLMHCVLEYPTPYEHVNLNKITSLKKKFPNCKVGYSDHTKPDENCDVLKMAYLLGAHIIEKHFTLDKSLKGNDHYHAMDSIDVKRIVESIKKIDELGGSYELQCLPSEKKARQNARRSLVASCNIPKGTIITEDMITWKRPGTGMPVNKYEKVIGAVSLIDINEDEVLRDNMIRN